MEICLSVKPKPCEKLGYDKTVNDSNEIKAVRFKTSWKNSYETVHEFVGL